VTTRTLAFVAGLAPALAAGWLGFPRLLYKQVEQPLSFSHKVHTGEKGGMACADCHSLGTDGRFSGIPRLEKCAGCHAQPIGATDGEKKFVDSFVATGREVPWLVYARQPDNVHFPHAVHMAGNAVACERCHGPHAATDTLRTWQVNRISGYSRDIWGPRIARVGRRPWEGMKMNDCIECHEERGRASSCLACHK
jgi:hypothetical protein